MHGRPRILDGVIDCSSGKKTAIETRRRLGPQFKAWVAGWEHSLSMAGEAYKANSPKRISALTESHEDFHPAKAAQDESSAWQVEVTLELGTDTNDARSVLKELAADQRRASLVVCGLVFKAM